MIAQPTPKIERTHRARTPHLRVVGTADMQLHAGDCGCRSCEPDRLTWVEMGKLATLAAAAVTGVMFVIDPAGTAAALLGTIGFVS
jgi:hypothetical protein